ncbi:hypothetical protein ASPSYDRAFT_88719 [Aspergillus sydowii CBS 593.65]|uniref:Uncharacterized protein n=1 Tax=Aspergillus sydowii CBS 593.65 TaxID=1036612 RepID=A0A1L9TK69_9EURO|nr:uncharacterized protein ASPSYDRAFT_88719 [Aspergillus sydowii CBS 593.65]OJJ59820.1 hypothetical protein ASPSYDRAFT_88719 [Aspergillus sydowii CBS 593.65]
MTNALLAKTGLSAADADVVGYDGQTIFQEPPGSYPRGLFIAESGVVAALTNITTVTQFRPVDHALGGLGPPPPARPYGNGNGDGNFEYRLDCESAARAPGQGPDVGVRYEAWECHD